MPKSPSINRANLSKTHLAIRFNTIKNDQSIEFIAPLRLKVSIDCNITVTILQSPVKIWKLLTV